MVPLAKSIKNLLTAGQNATPITKKTTNLIELFEERIQSDRMLLAIG